MKTKTRKGKCRFCRHPVSRIYREGLLPSPYRLACPECDVLTCPRCCYIHSECDAHPPKRASC